MKFEINETGVADFLRSQSFKATPEAVKAILKELEDIDPVGMLVSEVMYNASVPTLEVEDLP